MSAFFLVAAMIIYIALIKAEMSGKYRDKTLVYGLILLILVVVLSLSFSLR